MPQQINLLNSLPKPPRYYLSDKLIFLILGGYLAFLLILTIGQFILLGWGKYHLTQQQKIYLQQQNELNQNTLLAAFNNAPQLEKQLADKKLLLQTLESRKINAGQCSYLSYYFEVFSKSIMPGLWLTQINVDLGHDVMFLSGNTYTPILPISFIQTIQKSPCFNNRQFGPIELLRKPSEDNKNAKTSASLLEFTLKSSSTEMPAHGNS